MPPVNRDDHDQTAPTGAFAPIQVVEHSDLCLHCLLWCVCPKNLDHYSNYDLLINCYLIYE